LTDFDKLKKIIYFYGIIIMSHKIPVIFSSLPVFKLNGIKPETYVQRSTLITIIFLFTFFRFSFTQSDDVFSRIEKDNSYPGSVRIIQDDNIKSLVYKHIEHERGRNGIPGYRISVFFATGQGAGEDAFRIRSELNSMYSDIKVHIIHDDVYYRVYLGDFRTRSEAIKYLREVEKRYSGAYIVETTINFPPLD